MGNLSEMSAFLENFPNKKCGEISSFFACSVMFALVGST